MKLWRRAAGAMKDRKSLLIASMAPRSSCRHPDLEAAVIKATSHDPYRVDYNNFQRVFELLRGGPSSTIKPILYTLSRRVEKTRSWVVALKCLILLHGVLCSNLPALRLVARLPFNLAGFSDAYTRRSYAHSAFVRVYFAFLDRRTFFLASSFAERADATSLRARKPPSDDSTTPIGRELLRVQRWQHMLDMLMQIRPTEKQMMGEIVLEAMDCVISEIYGVYESICKGIASVLVRVYEARAFEAGIALRVLKKAMAQSEELADYFEFCREFGALNPSERPEVQRVPEEDIREVERIIRGLSEKSKSKEEKEGEEKGEGDNLCHPFSRHHYYYHHHHHRYRFHNSLLPHHRRENGDKGGEGLKRSGSLRTVISDEWVLFDEDLKVGEENRLIEYHDNQLPAGEGSAATASAPACDWSIQPHPVQIVHKNDLPDLINF